MYFLRHCSFAPAIWLDCGHLWITFTPIPGLGGLSDLISCSSSPPFPFLLKNILQEFHLVDVIVAKGIRIAVLAMPVSASLCFIHTLHLCPVIIRNLSTIGAPGRLIWLSVRLLVSAQAMISWFGSSSPMSSSMLMLRNLLGILSPCLYGLLKSKEPLKKEKKRKEEKRKEK